MYNFWPMHIKNIIYMWKRMTAFSKNTAPSSLAENTTLAAESPDYFTLAYIFEKQQRHCIFLTYDWLLIIHVLLMLNPGAHQH